MAVYTIEHEQFIPADIEMVWKFFSNPVNLGVITPPDMKFKQISASEGDKIYAGQLIRYRVSPMYGIRIGWLTEITQMEEQRSFIDEQRRGPFSLWKHQHFFEAVPGGTKMTDIIQYRVPGWWLGTLANKLFVHRRVKQIFEFRRAKTVELWGEWPGETPR